MVRSMAVLALVLPAFAVEPAGLVVHEWGTFTSASAPDGSAVPWVSLAPPADLPCFVYHLTSQCVKCGLSRVRMETPVVYFYSGRPVTASVHVDLPSGLISEWYPQATRTSALQPGLTYGTGGNIEWSRVEVLPGAPEDYPNAGDRSHYYAARETDSAPLRVGDQAEKVLFYRGIADFSVPVEPRFLPDGRLQIRMQGEGSIATAVLFENQAGRTGYRVIRDLRDQTLLDAPDLASTVESVHQELADALTAAGLYPKEAAAMIETWRDSWFEEGMRIFYLVPRAMVDAVLPIHITPKPQTLERVFVGRVEVLSPAMARTVAAALASGDTNTLARCRRFLRPWTDWIQAGPGRVQIAPAAAEFLSRAGQPSPESGSAPCRAETVVLPTEQR